MKSIRWKLVFMYLTLVFIVMLISGTFIILRIKEQEINKAEDELKKCALYVDEQIIQEYKNPQDFQNGFTSFPIMSSSMRNIQANILDENGETIASTVSSDKPLFLEYKNSVVISALSGKESFSSGKRNIDYNSQVKDWVSYAYPVKDSTGKVTYVIYVQMDAESINNSFIQTTNTIIIAVCLALFLTGILGLLFANTITTPIAVLTKKANQLAKGKLEQHIIVKSDDEIGQLTKSFNYMAKELRKTVSEMENENNKLEIVLHNMTDGVLAFDERGILIHANTVSYDMIDIDVAKISFQWFLEKINLKKEALSPDMIKEVTINENDKYINAVLIPYKGKNENVEGIVVVLQDITKHRKLDEMRKEFVANVSHEIRTPLTTIKSYAETLIDGAIDDKETAMDFLKIINDAADRMTILAKDLLDLSRLDSKNMNFNFEDINLVNIVFNCVKQNIISAKNKNQNIIFKEPENNEMIIYADSSRINQVINNIISNAMKYSPENTDILIKIDEKENDYCVEIKDSGIGISKEDLARIFERFYRVDKARSRSMGGNGLGLSIAKEIMEGHGGKIKAYSETGHGTTMILNFPKHI